MTHAHALPVATGESLRMSLLFCGAASAVVYVATDIAAARAYPGYSMRSQAVSELFAIGATTAGLVVPLFTLASLLVLAFAAGVWMSGHRFMATMFAASAVDSLVLWNFFPMHMRGETPGFTDLMHGMFAINPFVLAAIVGGAVEFRNWFRFYSMAVIVVLVVTATFGFSYARDVYTNVPTPWLGVTERVAQYSDELWKVLLAFVLVRK